MLIASLLAVVPMAQPQAESCPIIIAENFSILQFGAGSAALSGQVRLQLDNWLTIASGSRYPIRFQLIGNTDRVGSRAANHRLSFRRADAVRHYLVSHGVARGLITVSAADEDRGLVDTEDGVPEPINRVVQLLALWDEQEAEAPRTCAETRPGTD